MKTSHKDHTHSSTQKSHRLGIQAKMMLTMISSLVVVLVITGIVLSKQAQKELFRYMNRDITSQAMSIRDDIDSYLGNLQKIQEISTMESHLIENILNGMENFRIVVQPVVSTKDGIPQGAESLLRWRFQGEEISPADFIPIIEKAHMIHQVGRWVFTQAVHACVRLLTYAPDFYLTVNVSLQQLDDEGFVDFIAQTLRKYDLSGEHIVLELTESCMDNQPEKLEQFVKACGDLNIRIALDDFGSGYSSMRVLLRYPSSIIKLDRSLLLEMTDSYEKNGFITSLVYACHQFGKKVCMEGVETEFQYELVKEAGCDLIQGFYYYRPMELEQAYHLAAKLHGEKES